MKTAYRKMFSSLINRLCPRTRSPKEGMIFTALKFIKENRIEGTYLEFGVYEGDSLITAYEYAKNLNMKINFFAFDSFKGLPEAEEIFNKGQFFCPRTKFEQQLRNHNISLNEITVIEGYFNEIFIPSNSIPVQKASIIMIDCDLYSSSKTALSFCTSFIQEGTVLILDDYNFFKADPNKGERKALREWLNETGFLAIEFRKYGWHGVSFILHKPNDN